MDKIKNRIICKRCRKKTNLYFWNGLILDFCDCHSESFDSYLNKIKQSHKIYKNSGLTLKTIHLMRDYLLNNYISEANIVFWRTPKDIRIQIQDFISKLGNYNFKSANSLSDIGFESLVYVDEGFLDFNQNSDKRTLKLDLFKNKIIPGKFHEEPVYIVRRRNQYGVNFKTQFDNYQDALDFYNAMKERPDKRILISVMNEEILDMREEK